MFEVVLQRRRLHPDNRHAAQGLDPASAQRHARPRHHNEPHTEGSRHHNCSVVSYLRAPEVHDEALGVLVSTLVREVAAPHVKVAPCNASHGQNHRRDQQPPPRACTATVHTTRTLLQPESAHTTAGRVLATARGTHLQTSFGPLFRLRAIMVGYATPRNCVCPSSFHDHAVGCFRWYIPLVDW